MELSAPCVRDQLDVIAVEGWDSAVGGALLDAVRRGIVRPLVRRSGLRGPAADQAEATGWAAAWDALRRPSARTAGNPAGMAWVAARRAIGEEADATPVRVLPEEGDLPGPGAPDHEVPGQDPADSPLGPRLDQVLGLCVESGWDPEVVRHLGVALADHCAHAASGVPTVRWRIVARRHGVPEWQARRLASLLLGGPAGPGVLKLMVQHGHEALGDESVRAAVAATRNPRAASPEAYLASVPSGTAGGRSETPKDVRQWPCSRAKGSLRDMGVLPTLCADPPLLSGTRAAAMGAGATEPHGGWTRCWPAPGRPDSCEITERP